MPDNPVHLPLFCRAAAPQLGSNRLQEGGDILPDFETPGLAKAGQHFGGDHRLKAWASGLWEPNVKA